MSAPPTGDAPGRPGPSRRQLLTGAGTAGAGLVAGGLAGYFGRGAADPAAAADGDSDQTVPFYGPHQAGIATAAQDRLAFGSLNVKIGRAHV